MAKYIGFKSMTKKLAAKGATDPKALAAVIARNKYGAKAVQKAAAAGKSMRNVKPLAKK